MKEIRISINDELYQKLLKWYKEIGWEKFEDLIVFILNDYISEELKEYKKGENIKKMKKYMKEITKLMKKLNIDEVLRNKVIGSLNNMMEYLCRDYCEYSKEVDLYLFLLDIENLGFFEKEMGLNECDDPETAMDLSNSIDGFLYCVAEELLEKLKE